MGSTPTAARIGINGGSRNHRGRYGWSAADVQGCAPGRAVLAFMPAVENHLIRFGRNNSTCVKFRWVKRNWIIGGEGLHGGQDAGRKNIDAGWNNGAGRGIDVIRRERYVEDIEVAVVPGSIPTLLNAGGIESARNV